MYRIPYTLTNHKFLYGKDLLPIPNLSLSKPANRYEDFLRTQNVACKEMQSNLYLTVYYFKMTIC